MSCEIFVKKIFFDELFFFSTGDLPVKIWCKKVNLCIVKTCSIFHNFIHRRHPRFSTGRACKLLKISDLLKHFLLDLCFLARMMAYIVRLLTGGLTGTGRWNGCGDTSFDGKDSGMDLPVDARSRSRKACWKDLRIFRVTRIKTGNAQRH